MLRKEREGSVKAIVQDSKNRRNEQEREKRNGCEVGGPAKHSFWKLSDKIVSK